MSGIVGSKLNIRGSGTVAKLGTDGQHLLSSGAGKSANYETVAAAAYDDDKLQSNIALLGFKCAVNGSLAKYNLQDQIIDEYEDATGIDAGASTNEQLSSGSYYGGASATITAPGTTSVDGAYTIYHITADGNFITDINITADYLIVGGGGGGGNSVAGAGEGAGGGGGGGVIYATSQSLSAGTFAVVSGDGGVAAAVGGDSSFNSQTAGGGGEGGDDEGAGSPPYQDGGAGRATDGSGGGGSQQASGGAGDGNGNAGGDGGSSNAGGGGGGRGSAGANASGGVGNNGGDGGTGLANSITGSEVYYGAGGGGANEGVGVGGDGGSSVGGDGASATGAGRVATAGINGSGGGGGTAGRTAGGAGGDGVVIVRRLTSQGTSYNDLTLQSTDTTASTANPDYADMVILMEDDTGTATLNTDIKGYISEDSGVTFTQGTLVDEGSWGTNKKIVAFHDLDISAQSGSSMCYKITTHNQSVSKITNIHATSIGWR